MQVCLTKTYFSDIKTLVLYYLYELLYEPQIPQKMFRQVYSLSKWLENVALLECCCK